MDLAGKIGLYLYLPVLASLDVPLVVFLAIEYFIAAQGARKLGLSRNDSPMPARKQVLLVLFLSWADYVAALAIKELLDLVSSACATLHGAVDPCLHWDRGDLSPALVLQTSVYGLLVAKKKSRAQRSSPVVWVSRVKRVREQEQMAEPEG